MQDIDTLRNSASPAVFFSNGLGDHILVLPTIRALSHIYGDKLRLVCGIGISSTFFRGVHFAKELEIPITYNGLHKLFDAKKVLTFILPCDLFLSPNPWYAPDIEVILEGLGDHTSVGYFDEYTIRVPRDGSPHAADLAFRVIQQLQPELKIEDFVSPPDLDPSSLLFASEFKAKFGDNKNILGIHAETFPRKMWKSQYFSEVLQLFLREHSDFIVCNFGLTDIGVNAGRYSERFFNIFRYPIHHSFALIQQSSLFLGIDSCMLHAADYWRIPGVGLFGPTKSTEFGFRFAPHRHLQANLSLTELSPKDVYTALENLWGEVK